MIKRYGPQEINRHFVAFNTICDATQERQDAMYKMFGAEYQAPQSALYAELEGEQVGVELGSARVRRGLSSRRKEDELRGTAAAPGGAPGRPVDVCLVVGGFNSSNTTHLLEIAEEEGVPGYHIDCAQRIGRGNAQNSIEHKPLVTPPSAAMLDEGLEVREGFLPEGPIVVGITSGASTPDNVVGEVLERILLAKGAKQS